MASNESVKGIFKWQTLKQPKLVQLDKVSYRGFTAMSFEWKLVTDGMIIKKDKSFYDEMEVTSAHSQRAGCKI
jgi:hypothetical protein